MSVPSLVTVHAAAVSPLTALPAEVVMLVPLSKVIGFWAGVSVKALVAVPVQVIGAEAVQVTWARAATGTQTASTAIAKAAGNASRRPRRGALLALNMLRVAGRNEIWEDIVLSRASAAGRSR